MNVCNTILVDAIKGASIPMDLINANLFSNALADTHRTMKEHNALVRTQI